MNSIVDEECIDALYRAAEAGVKIDLVVRGICALKAGVEGMSKNIRVRSILGRFLEHSRIYAFCNSLDDASLGGDTGAGSSGAGVGAGATGATASAGASTGVRSGSPRHEVWIGSADLMHRNLDRRVEALIRIIQPNQVEELINLLNFSMSDKVSAWDMNESGIYQRCNLDSDGQPLVDIQAEIVKKSRKASGTIKLK
jgi:polyphosphate kinase